MPSNIYDKVRIKPELKDRLYRIFPHGISIDIGLDYINTMLRRVDLYAVSRFPRMSIEIRSIEEYTRSCLRDCEDNTCRSLHGDCADDVQKLHETCFEVFYDELYYITSRRRIYSGEQLAGSSEYISGPSFKYTYLNEVLKRPILVSKFISNRRGLLVDAGASYMRDMLRQTSFARKVLPPSHFDFRVDSVNLPAGTIDATLSLEVPHSLEYVTYTLKVDDNED